MGQRESRAAESEDTEERSPCVPPETEVSCRGCGAVFCPFRNSQPGNWIKQNKAAWYFNEMDNVNVIQTAAGVWSSLRFRGVLVPNAVQWHLVRCASCSRVVGSRRGALNPEVDLSEPSQSTEGWYLVNCNNVALGIPPNTDIACSRVGCNAALCIWADNYPGTWTKKGRQALYFRRMNVDVRQGQFGSLRAAGTVYKNAVRWDKAYCKCCGNIVASLRGPLNPDITLPPNLRHVTEGMCLVSLNCIAMQPRRWWTPSNHRMLLPAARRWVVAFMMLTRRVALSAERGQDTEDETQPHAMSITHQQEFPALPLEMWFHILLHLHGGHMLPQIP
mmetsp:Transcript_28207/g.39642  ORF Transcript_28207/g.39642 Transcript_28207/m.39642 type:complete len:333 (-) Transcript_28207:52-1050(-)